MAKEVMTIIKLQVPAGGANPSPPVGPPLITRPKCHGLFVTLSTTKQRKWKKA